MARRIVDLTFPIHEGMTTFPRHWHPFVEITQLGRFGIEDRETRKVVLGTHTGTHCDAPRHFIPEAPTIDAVPLETLIGPARRLDFRDVAPGHAIGIADLQERLGGDLGWERLILQFGWDRHWGHWDYYQNHPYLTAEAAQWLVDQGLRLLAMDTPMPDNPADGWQSGHDSPIHKILLGQGVILTEYLCNLAELSGPWVELIVMPLKIAGGDGAPARVAAMEMP